MEQLIIFDTWESVYILDALESTVIDDNSEDRTF